MSSRDIGSAETALWRECVGCGVLAALPSEVFHCESCQAEPVREAAVLALLELAARHRGDPAEVADGFARMADAYQGLAGRRSGVWAVELANLAVDLRVAAGRLRDESSRRAA